MRSLVVGAALGALCLLGACVDQDSPVASSKQIGQLSGEEMIYLCDWAVRFMGGEEARHACPVTEPGTMNWVTTWNNDECLDFVVQLYDDVTCNRVTVGEFESLVEEVADDPCKDQSVAGAGGTCIFGTTVKYGSQ